MIVFFFFCHFIKNLLVLSPSISLSPHLLPIFPSNSLPFSSFSFLPLLFLLQSWDVFFRNANAGAPPGAAYQSPLGLSAAPQLSSLVGAQPNVEKLVEDHLAVQSLIRAYQVRVDYSLHEHLVCKTTDNTLQDEGQKFGASLI